LHGSTLNKRTSDRASDEAAVVGDGRKTLTLKKGRAVAGILHGQTGDAEANGLVVKADSVLADVSEAYGAEGDEPEGFKVGFSSTLQSALTRTDTGAIIFLT
jgi:hypothetical protein